MPIKAKCANCETTYNLADAMEGKKVKCKECGEAFLVKPSRGGDTSDKLRSGPPSRGPAPAPKRRPKDTNPDDEDDRPRRKKKKEKEPTKSGMMWWLIGGGAAMFLLLLVGGGIIAMVVFWGNKATPENFAKIREGMTEKEVIDIMGRPTENVGFNNAFTQMAGIKGLPNVKVLYWEGKRDSVYEVVLKDGKVVGAVGTDGNRFMAPGFDEDDPFAGGQWPLNNKPPINQQPNNPPANNGNNQLAANWGRVQIGMTEQQVIALLGQPQSRLGDANSPALFFGSPPGDSVNVGLRDGKVFMGGGQINGKLVNLAFGR